MSARIAYFDCFSGASGDMLLGAWLDAGLDLCLLERDLESLGLTDYRLKVERRADHGITGTKFDVLDEGSERPATHLCAVREIIARAGLPQPVAEASLAVFARLAEAEARIHGTTVDEVHFHEVGAVDTLIDVVGFCLAVHRLEIQGLYASALPVGRGTVRTEHGLLPVPAPATLALLASAGAPILPSRADGELVTPTGAALLSTLATFEQPAMIVRQVGYGFGSKRFAWPNVVRVWIGEPYEAPQCAGHWHDAAHSHAEMHDHPHAHPHGGHEHTHNA
ncbi:MAG: LarC family nickel insertion protein [Chloroflexi bacterium]|nr:LarC family nickel insertion protein [Chloroflexota bacterium]